MNKLTFLSKGTRTRLAELCAKLGLVEITVGMATTAGIATGGSGNQSRAGGGRGGVGGGTVAPVDGMKRGGRLGVVVLAGVRERDCWAMGLICTVVVDESK